MKMVEETVDGAAAEPKTTNATKDIDNNNDDDDDDDDVEEQDNDNNANGETKKKKKKRKKKKKKKAGLQSGAPGLEGPVYGMSDQDFDAMIKRYLEETKSQVEGVPQEVLHEPPSHFVSYQFTGELRPHYVSKQMTVTKPEVPLPDYAETGDPVSEREGKTGGRIPVLEGNDIDIMRHVSQMGREVLDVAGRFVKAGVSCDEIDRVVYMACMERNVYPSPLNYHNFPKSCCTSLNEVICHGIPDQRVLRDGDIVNIDISVFGKLEGSEPFHTDLNETFLIGKVDEDGVRVVQTAYECLRIASLMIRPKTLYRELGDEIHKHSARNQCQVTKRYSGHGVGRLFHGLPNVPHIRNNKAIGVMRPGHCFTVEPMINLGTWQDDTWPDDWTAVTRDGKRSAQFEHTFLVTEEGVEILTARAGTNRNEMPEWDINMFQR